MKEFNIINFKSIDSTQKEAIRLIERDEIIKNTVITTSKQISGIGRTGNKWFDGDGNLMVSIIFLNGNDFKFEKIKNETSLIVGMAIYDSLKDIGIDILNVKIKKPNDLLINNKKFCGIIVNFTKWNNIDYCIVGIGMNIKSNPYEIENSGNLLNEAGILIDLENILNLILKNINEYFITSSNFTSQMYVNKLKDVICDKY